MSNVDVMDFMMSELVLRDEPYEDFPVYFALQYPHMILIRQSKGYYTMFPPNQLDWKFEIKVDDFAQNVWYVVGMKDDNMDEMSLKYIKSAVSSQWEGKPWYP